MGLTVGIDLGTTNSCVAVIRDDRPRVIEDERGYNILPSCIAMKGRGRFNVGHAAKAMVLTDPQSTLYSIKRVIGRKFDSEEVQAAMQHVSFEVSAGERGNVQLHLGEIELTPVEASSIILKAVKEIAEKALGEAVTDAVITVPANFNHAQRKATMEAGESAGLNVLRLLNEPTAAALAFGFKKDVNKKIAVYDLGGGTFDISVLQVGDGVYEILGTDGNTFLGGEDFDYRIVDWLADIFQQRFGEDPRQDLGARQRLRDAAERAKCELSFVDKTPILIPHLVGSNNLEVELSREQLEEMVEDLIKETIKITDQSLRSAGVGIDELDELILVGGMTRMPKIQETLQVFFGKNPCKGVHPEEVVAIGAAVHSYNLQSDGDSTLLLDVTPFSLGVDTAGGFFKPIVEKNTTVPCSESTTFTTVRDGQSEVKITVRQGENKVADENSFLGEFVLTGVRQAEKMVPRIDVTFRIDSNGILHVSAVDRDTNQGQAIEIRDYIDHEDTDEGGSRAVAATNPKVSAVDQPDLPPPRAPASSETGSADESQGADADDGGKKGGFMGRLKKMAGLGKKEEQAGEAGEAGQEVVSREDRGGAEPFGIESRSQADAPGPAGAATPEPATSAPASGMVEAPAEAEQDPFGVQGEQSAAAKAEGRTDTSIVNTADIEDLDEFETLDPFAVAPRTAAAARKSPAAPAEVPAPPPPGPAEAAAAGPPPPEAPATPPDLAIEAAAAQAPPAAESTKKRRPARLRISYKKSSTFVREYERNLKRGGTFIKTKTPLEVGRDCVLLLTVPDLDDTIAVRGAVVWSSLGLDDLQGQEEGMGIRYDEDDAEGMSSLKSALSQLSADGD